MVALLWQDFDKNCLVGEIKPGRWGWEILWAVDLLGLFGTVPVGVELGFTWAPDEDGHYKVFPH